MKPAYVVHDGKRWYVTRPARVDGAPGYVLRDPRGHVILARVAECEEWKRKAESLRVFRMGDFVLEVLAAGSLAREVRVRRARSSKRWPTSVQGIYSMTVAAHVARKRRPRRRGL